MDIQAILFDLDDTLFAYAPCNAAGLDAACDVMRGQLDVSRERFRELHDSVRSALAKELAGQPASHNRVLFFKRMIEMSNGADDPGLVLQTHRAYWDAFYAAMQPAAHAHDVLQTLAGRYRLALLSNHVTEAQLGKVRQLNLMQYFPIIVTSEEIGAEKPAATMFEHALRRLGSPSAQRTLMVGDSIAGDIAGAKAMGMHAVHTREFVECRDNACGSDACVANISELLRVLDVQA